MGIRYLYIIYIYYMRMIFNTKIHPRFSLSSELERLLWLDAFCHLYLYLALLNFTIGHIADCVYSAVVVIFVNYHCGNLLLYTTEHSAIFHIWNTLVWQYRKITGLANNRIIHKTMEFAVEFSILDAIKNLSLPPLFWGVSSPTL